MHIARSTSALLVVSLLGTSCVLLSSGDTTQCESDADCEFEGSTCDTEVGVCVTAVVDATTTAQSSSGETVSASSSSGDVAGCVSNSQCIDDFGLLPYICREPGQPCQPLLNENCTEFVGEIDALRDEDPLIVGHITRYEGGTDEELGSAVLSRNGLALALKEIDAIAKGLPLGTGGARRRFVGVGCDATSYIDSARHLVEDIGVPVLISSMDEDKALEVAVEVTVPNEVMMFIGSARSEANLTLNDEGLVWLPSYIGESQGASLAKFQGIVEVSYRERNELPEEEPFRTAVVSRDDLVGITAGEVLADVFSSNGLDYFDNIAAGYVLPRSYDNTLDNLDFSSIVPDLVDFQPHAIIVLGSLEANPELILQLEAALDNVGDPIRPVYIIDETGYDYTMDLALIPRDEVEESIVFRVYGTRPRLPLDDSIYQAYLVRYQSEFDAFAGSYSSLLTYDMAYSIAYAALGAGNVPRLDGKAIASGMSKLGPAGSVVEAGPGDINSAISVLKAGSSIDFEGTLGPYNWDLANGFCEPFMGGYCYRKLGGVIDTNFTDHIYDPETGEMDGEYGACTPYF